ncbi:MAG: YdcF family protein [Elainella sp.]
MPIPLTLPQLDSSLCQPQTASGQWANLTWWLFGVLTNPAWVVPILVGLILLPWLLRLRWKRQISSFGCAGLLLYSLVCSPLGVQWGSRALVGLLPQDGGQTSEAIVVLGRGPELRSERIQEAVTLWQQQRAPLVFVSGWGDAEPMQRLLIQQGLWPEAVAGEPCSRTTEENAQFTAALLQPQGIRRILLVTDSPHMLRSWLTFRSFGFVVAPHPNALPPQFQLRKQAFLLVREYLGLASYGLLGRFSPRMAPAADLLIPGLQGERMTTGSSPASAHAAE